MVVLLVVGFNFLETRFLDSSKYLSFFYVSKLLSPIDLVLRSHINISEGALPPATGSLLRSALPLEGIGFEHLFHPCNESNKDRGRSNSEKAKTNSCSRVGSITSFNGTESREFNRI